MEIREKIVDFEKYCKECKYKEYPNEAIPCCYCLDESVNEFSHKPVKFEQSEKSKQKEKIRTERKVLQSRSRMRTPARAPKTAVVDSDNVINKIKEMNSR